MLAKLISFLQESKAELKLVTWPRKDQIVRLTGLVLAITVAVALFIAALDFLFSLGIEWILAR